jgi:malonyl-CoA O-methyltransferase
MSIEGSPPPLAPPFELDRRALVRSFSRAAPHYEAAAGLQRRVRSELLERLQYFKLEPQRVLDLGAGAGPAAQLLQQRFKHAQVLALDIAEGMLRAVPGTLWPWRWSRWRRPRFVRICGDAAALPLAAHSIDLVYSNLMLQWCDRPDAVFRELARVLRPGGVLLFSTFGPDTLGELRSAWAEADDHSHVSLFADMQQLADGLMRAGFAEPVTDLEHYTLHYPDAHTLMRELKQLGAGNATRTRNRGLTGRARMQHMLSAYERARTAAGLPATFEVIFGAAFGGAAVPATQAGGGVPGEFAVPVGAIRSARR